MGTRADNHDGSCREVLKGRHAGKWRVQFTLVSESGLKSRISRLFRNKTEAKEFLRELRRGKRVQQATRSRELTLADWFNWLSENDWPETLAAVTIAQRKSRFRNYIANHLGDTPLSMIDPLQVKAFYNHLRDSGVSNSLLLSIKSDLVRTFNQGITPYQRVPMTVANPFRLPLQQPSPRNAIALTPEEVRTALIQSDLDLCRKTMLGMFLLAGLRLGEVMAITRGQIRLEENLITIDRAVQISYGGKQTIGLPKGDKTRSAVICQTLKTLIAEHVNELKTEDLLWPARTENKPRMKKLFYSTWRTIVKDAKLPASMTPHDCRLTHINLIEKLMPAVSTTALKEHVGHASTGVTESNYTRPLSTAQSILRDELDRVLGQRGLT